MEILLALGLTILLMSNIWLLREHEKTRSRLEQYRAEITALDDRIYQILIEIDLRSRTDGSEELENDEARVLLDEKKQDEAS